VSYGEVNLDGTVPASGILSITFGPKARTRSWLVSQITIQMDGSPLGSYAQLFKGDRLVSPMLSTDVAGAGAPILLSGTETMTVTWRSTTSGLQGRVFVIYDDQVV
jgi:hypothetical protein